MVQSTPPPKKMCVCVCVCVCMGDKQESYIVPTTGLRGMYFLPMTIGVRKVASRKIACDEAGTNHKAAAEFERWSPLSLMLWNVIGVVVIYYLVAVVAVIF